MLFLNFLGSFIQILIHDILLPTFMNIHDNHKKHKIHFLTFCAGNDFAGSLQKIHDEAKHITVFDQIHTMNDIDIQKDTHFWEQHKEFIQKNPRGWGYWLWKSYINLCLIEKINRFKSKIYYTL